MKKFWLRIITFIVAVPTIVVITLWLNFFNYLLISIWVTAFAAIGALEALKFFRNREAMGPPWLLAVLSASFPVAAYLRLWFSGLDRLPEVWLVIVILFIFLKVTFIDMKLVDKTEDFTNFFPNLSGSIIIVIYTGFLLSFLIRIMEFDNASFGLLLLFALVFGNDAFAYLGGKFLGKTTRLNLVISPNKTLIGFISGFLGTILLGVAFYYLIPGLFNTHIVCAILFFALIAVITILGDLVESAMKRASAIKDSGTLMAGRGGILDSVDSLLVSVPIFYFVFPIISG